MPNSAIVFLGNFQKKCLTLNFIFSLLPFKLCTSQKRFFFFMNHVDPDNYIYVKHAENSLFIQLGKK